MKISFRQRALAASIIASLTCAVSQTFASPGPQPLPSPPSIQAPKDLPYFGAIGLTVDAHDVGQHIFFVTEDVPVSESGDLVLLFPKWIPGSHAPTGLLNQLAGLEITAAGRPVTWRRDPVDMYAFHVDVPVGATDLRLKYQSLTAAENSAPRVETPAVLDLDWPSVVLYPAGHFARQINLRPSVTLPSNWAYASALKEQGRTGDTISFSPVSLETLVDSPLLAGRYMRKIPLGSGAAPVTLDVAADEPDDLKPTAGRIDAYKVLVGQAALLFGSHHYSHYDFLVWLSAYMSGKDREHLQSSEIGFGTDYLGGNRHFLLRADTLPHEYTHSWNGKFRRPAGLWAPNFNVPERNSLLWVYEGLTEYWGKVLTVRSGLWTRQDALDSLALTAAQMDARTGRSWRSLADTVNVPIISYSTFTAWPSWERDADYYAEGELIWLDVDTLIRERSGGRRSLDDFAKAFFGKDDGNQVIETYTFDDVVAALNSVEPYEWATFLRGRLEGHGAGAPLDGLTRGGYRLVYTDTPSAYTVASEAGGRIDLTPSVGIIVRKDGLLEEVQWDGPAFHAGLAPDDTILSIDGTAYTPEALKMAVTEAIKTGSLDLIVRSEGRVGSVRVSYNGGLRYPHLVRVPGTPDRLGKIFEARLAPHPSG